MNQCESYTLYESNSYLYFLVMVMSRPCCDISPPLWPQKLIETPFQCFITDSDTRAGEREATWVQRLMLATPSST